MFWDKEKIVAVYQIPEGIEGQPYIRHPNEEDKKSSTKRIDRETGKYITLWEEKLRYPYKTTVAFTLVVCTNIRTYKFELKLEKEPDSNKKCWIWNGQNISKIAWSILGISKHSPEGLEASCWHDALLYHKEYYLNQLKKEGIDISVSEYRRLTTLIFREILKNYGVGTIKANIMSGAVGGWQFVSPQWWGME